MLATLRVRIRTEKNGANQSVKLNPRLRIEPCTHGFWSGLSPHIFWLQLGADRSPGPKIFKAGIFTSAFLSFSFFFFRKMTRSMIFSGSRRVSNFFICLFIFIPLPRRCRRPCHMLRLEKTLRLRRDCLPRNRYIGCEAPSISFLPGVLHRHSQLPRKWSKLKFRSSPEVGGTSSKSSRRHFLLPWCTPYVNVKLSRAWAELKITYQLYGLSIGNPIRKVRIAEPLYQQILPQKLFFKKEFLSGVIHGKSVMKSRCSKVGTSLFCLCETVLIDWTCPYNCWLSAT